MTDSQHKGHRGFFKRNLFFTVFSGLQMVIVLAMIVGLAAKPVEATFTAGDLLPYGDDAVRLAPDSESLIFETAAGAVVDLELAPYLHRPGAYQVEARYHSVQNTDNPARNVYVVMLCAIVLVPGCMYLQFGFQLEEGSFVAASRTESMAAGRGEYILMNSVVSQSCFDVVEVGSSDATVRQYREDGTLYVSCANNAEQAETITLPLWGYDHYRGYDMATGQAVELQKLPDNRLTVSLSPGYEGTVKVVYTPPMLWRIAEGVSLACFVFLLFLCVAEFRRSAKPSITA